MKKVIEVSVGRMSFTIDEDAYLKLQNYLNRFKSTIVDPIEADEVMEDVEARVAEIFMSKLKFKGQVVDLKLVNSAIEHLGEIETEQPEPKMESENVNQETATNTESKRLFRDTDRKSISGVCSGLSYYFNIDVTIIRILFVIFFVFYGSGLMLYIVLWLVMPKAITVPQKLQMRGITPTAENIRKFTNSQKY